MALWKAGSSPLRPTCGAGFHCITASLGLNSSRRFAQAPCSLASALMQSASYPRSPSCIAPRRRRPLSYRCGDRRRGGCLSTIPGWSRATRRSAVVRRVPAARAEGSAATREKKHSPGSCKSVEIWRTRRDSDIRPLPLGRLCQLDHAERVGRPCPVQLCCSVQCLTSCGESVASELPMIGG